jgi:DNA repair exonuclease SbcCD ATPase subunit
MTELGKKLVAAIDELAEEKKHRCNLRWYPSDIGAVKKLAEELDARIEELEKQIKHEKELLWKDLWEKIEAVEKDCHIGRVPNPACPVCGNDKKLAFRWNGDGTRRSIKCENCSWGLGDGRTSHERTDQG